MNKFETIPFEDCGSKLARDWEILAQSQGCNPTLSPNWLAAVASALCPVDCRLQLLTRRRPDGSLSAIFPYFLSGGRIHGISVAILQPGSNLMSYHAEIIATDDVDEVLDKLLRQCSDWDVVHFANVPLESASAASLRAMTPRLGSFLQVIEGDESPYLVIDGGWDRYLASRNKKFRYKYRQRRELFTDVSVFCLKWFTEPSDVDRLLADMLVVEQRSWKSEAGLSIDAHETELRYHRRLLPVLAREGSLLANVLYRATRPIAYSLCCHYGGWVGHLKTSFDQEFAALSPGGYVIDASVKRAFDLRAREFDFLGDAAPHKLAWTSATRRHGDFFLFGRSWKGRLLGLAKRFGRWRRAAASPPTEG